MCDTGNQRRRFAGLCRGVQTVHESHELFHVCTTMFVPLRWCSHPHSLQVSTDEPDEQSKSLILSEVAEYLSRAETIKKHLDSLKESRTMDKFGLSRTPPRPPEVVFLHVSAPLTDSVDAWIVRSRILISDCN